jgi:hypothetical protein
MPTFFHVSLMPLIAGQVLGPGQWGHTSRRFSKGGQPLSDVRDAFILIWETTLEAVRREVKPDAPSRLECVFACETVQEATAFRDHFRQGAQIYRVEVIGSPDTHRGDYDLITGSGTAPFIDHIAERARRYWTDQAIGMPELLIGGSVTVLGLA